MYKNLPIYLVLISICILPGYGQNQRKLRNPNPSKEAAAVYCYIQSLMGKKTLSGQQWSNSNFNEISYIQNTTGKTPAIIGLDFIHESTNPGYVVRATEWWKKGGLPSIMWHMGAPSKGEGYPSSQLTIDINKVFQTGTAENKAFWDELKKKGDYLEKLRDLNVPILWRPFHELNGGWFWWGKGGPALFKKLYITMFNYFVNERKLNNLIWVLGYANPPNGSWFPGNEYVDIAGSDTYVKDNSPQAGMYRATNNSIGGNVIPLVFHECAVLPDPDQCKSQNAMWTWWMQWNQEFVSGTDKNYLKKVYNHDLIITMDEIPDLVNQCGNVPCQPTTITPSVQMDGGEWKPITSVNVPTGSTVILGPQPVTEGSWTWSGCGATGTAREQTIHPTANCTATATYMNSCGQKSTIDFKITSNVTSVFDRTDHSSIILYPTPCKENINIKMDDQLLTEVSQVQIFTLDGRLAKAPEVITGNINSINTMDLSNGMYILKITTGSKTYISNFSKMQ